ncbi:interferon regulatory factor 3-like isoform X1 [Protopterus annectens]|uniref:interferon regulatory factor 3-like isoform X1 n=1 Tax=Protopterus annectens TaxID=7888 RepID=UPI001CFC280E|nr:interferon regulatory factor 3-like isoform X1 [Protopterus annectens]
MLRSASHSQNNPTFSNRKPLLSHWLIQQIDSGEYPGLYWLDTNRTKFRIPWKHISRSDISPNDYKLFMAWASVTGKYNGLQSEFNPATWKSTFRSALFSCGRFKKLENNVDNPVDPHKVYEVISSSSTSCRRGAACGQQLLQNNIPEKGMPLHSLPSYANDPLVHGYNPEVPLLEIPCYGVLEHEQIPVQNAYNPTMSSSQSTYEQPDQRMNGFRTELPNRRPLEATASTVLEAAALSIRPEPFSSQLEYNIPTQHCYTGPALNHLEFIVNYRKTEVLHTYSRGFNIYQLCYKHDICYGQQIHFPSPETLPSKKQVSFTKKILDNIKNGLLIEIKKKGVFAKRLGESHVYHLLEDLPDKTNEIQTINLLPRNEERKIFCFEKFLHDLENFKKKKATSPKFEIYLCFGQRMHDLQHKEKKLILVKIVPKFCSYLYEVAQREGASSLNSDTVSLQISNNSLYDIIDSFLNSMDVDMNVECFPNL